MTPGCASGFAEAHDESWPVRVTRELRRADEMIMAVMAARADRERSDQIDRTNKLLTELVQRQSSAASEFAKDINDAGRKGQR